MKRIQVEMSDQKLEELDELMREADIRTRKDLINRALSLLKWYMGEKAENRIIASVDEKNGNYKELVMG